MASINYESIFKLFLGSVTDYKLASLEENDATDLMKEYLHKALGASYLREIFSSIALDDDAGTIGFEMMQPTDLESDSEFVKSAISKWMVYEWVANQVNNTTLTQQMIFSSKEKSFYSQANHLTTLMELKDHLYKEARNFVMDRGFMHNSYLGG